MKKITLLMVLFALISCTNQETPVTESEPKKVEIEEVEKPYSNPAIIYGSDFMSFMQSLRKIGNYETMLCFTSSESVQKFGKEKVKKYYEEKFTNMSKLDLKSITDNSDGTKTMNYVNLLVATKSATSVNVIIENDSCKLVIMDLNKKII